MDEILKKLGFSALTLSPTGAINTHTEHSYENNIKKLLGVSSGRLTVVGYDPYHVAKAYVLPNTAARKAACCLCRCSCGNYFYARSTDIKTHKTRSCGCWHDEHAAKLNATYSFKHGDTRTRLYNMFWGMIRRCYNCRDISYPDYGGRGIRICDRWYTPADHSTGWVEFKNWAYANGYHNQPKTTARGDVLSIERLDSDGDYCPDNCVWIPLRLQSRNTRKSRYYNINIGRISAAEWNELTGIASDLVSDRMSRGWSEYDSVTIPVRTIRLACGMDTVINAARYDGPRYDSSGILRDVDGFMIIV